MPSHILPLSNILTRQVDSATIVHREGVCLGIKTSGDLFFPFREMTVRVDEAREAVIFELEVYFSSDLMAMATILGMDGQSGCSCPWCRGAARDFKATACGGARMSRRTQATQKMDFEEYEKSVRQAAARHAKTKPEPKNGVSAQPLVPWDFSHVLPPYLHLILGLVNDFLKEFRKEFQLLDNLDPEKVRLH